MLHCCVVMSKLVVVRQDGGVAIYCQKAKCFKQNNNHNLRPFRFSQESTLGWLLIPLFWNCFPDHKHPCILHHQPLQEFVTTFHQMLVKIPWPNRNVGAKSWNITTLMER